MASDVHIKLDGVEGESDHKDHKGEIEVMSWSWSVSNASSADAGGGSGKGKAQAADLSFMHMYDKASPTLAKHCVSGKHFDTLVLTCRKPGEGQQVYLTITLKEAYITSVAAGGSGDGEVTENVTVSYKDVEFTYKPQTGKGGTGGDVKFGWNIASTETR